MTDLTLSTTEPKDRMLRWLLTGNPGESSKTMVCVALGLRSSETPDGFSIPWDACDFGRCYRLLQVVPELRGSFPIIKTAYPMFGPILDAWDDLVSLYLTNSEECYALLKRLRADCLLASGGKTSSGDGTWITP